MKIGIESISFYSSHYFIDLKHIANDRGTPVEKFYHGIGQEKMATPPPDEDIITLGANAALEAVSTVNKDQIDTLIFATESGIDQSKSAGVYVHHLLGLNKNCRVIEVKQACYSGAAAVQMAIPYVAMNPDRKVLLVASDVARYGIGSAGEPTQGAGAIAIVISAEPKIIAFDKQSGMYTEDVMDFWRPNYRDEALVDGKLSIKMYIKALMESWKQYCERTGVVYEDFYRFCYHLPFSRMGEKAHFYLAENAGKEKYSDELITSQIADSMKYIRIVGNTYTASLFIGFLSLLDNSAEDLSGKKIGFFSYGSGCVGEFFSGEILPGYRNHLNSEKNLKFLSSRKELNYEQYKEFYLYNLPEDGGDYETPVNNTGHFRFAALKNHKRVYQRLD